MRISAAGSRLQTRTLLVDALTVAVGIGCTFTVRLGGEIPVAEITLAALLPLLFILQRKNLSARSGFKFVFLLAVLWLGNQAATDLYRNTERIEMLHGNGQIILFLLDLVGLTLLLDKNNKSKAIFATALCIGTLLAAHYQPTAIMEDDLWKFGYASGVNFLLALVSCFFYRYRNYPAALFFLLLIAGINLIANFRSPVLSVMVTIVLTMPLIPERVGRLKLMPRNGTAAHVAVLVVMALSGGLIASSLVHFATTHALVDEEAQIENTKQAEEGFLSARPEILVSSRAVLDHPIIGFGSGAKDFKYIEMLIDIEAKRGSQDHIDYVEALQGGEIPTHSHLMGAWVGAGILGAVFWIYVFVLGCKGLASVSMQRPSMAPFYGMLLAAFLFDILFSPFGNTPRIWAAFSIIVILDLLQKSTNSSRAAAWLKRPKWRRLSLQERTLIRQKATAYR